jgi:hypothetical protein
MQHALTCILPLLSLLACSGPAAPPSGPEQPDARPATMDLAPPVPDLAPPGPITGPERLSETGLFADFAARKLAPGVMPYTPRYQLWSDGADKERFLYLPPGAVIDTSDMDRWIFPVGTKAWKHFRAGGKLIETRFLWKARDELGEDGWFRIAYLWNEEGTEATAVPQGARSALGTSHDVPKQDECGQCHGAASDFAVGIGAIQLSSGRGDGLLLQLAGAGRLSARPPGEFSPPGSGVTQAALGYIHANCGAGCHNPRNRKINPRLFPMELSVKDRTPEETALYRVTARAALFHELPGGITRVLVPGDPDRSGLLALMLIRDGFYQMPPLATKIVDMTGAATVRQWIASLPK